MTKGVGLQARKLSNSHPPHPTPIPPAQTITIQINMAIQHIIIESFQEKINAVFTDLPNARFVTQINHV